MRFKLTIPPRTPIGAPVTAEYRFARNEISREHVHVPSGHAYLAGLQMRAGQQLSIYLPEPGSGEEWITGNGSDYNSSFRIVLDPPQYTIKFSGYNLDDTYEHSFYIDLD